MTDLREMFGETVQIGEYESRYEPDWARVRGAMLKWAREVDEIRSEEGEPDANVAYNRWIQWMQQQVDGNFISFASGRLGTEECTEKMRGLFADNAEFRELVCGKWTEKERRRVQDDGESLPSPESGAGGGSDGGGGGDSGPTGLSDYAEKYGAAEGNGHSEAWQATVSGKTGRNRGRAVRGDVETLGDGEMRNEILLGNVYEVLDRLETDSVDTVVTSPPYYDVREYSGAGGAVLGGDPDCDHTWLRDECRKCGAWLGQLGNEDTPGEFVDHLLAIFGKIKRVVKPSGSIWINIDDTYGSKQYDDDVGSAAGSACMVPERLFAGLVEQGWLVRDKVLWIKQTIDADGRVKGNANPTSVTSRFNSTWEPFYRLTQGKDDYFDLYSVMRKPKGGLPDGVEKPSEEFELLSNIPNAWRLPTATAKEAHFAVFSERFPERPIEATCPEKVCAMCGKPYEREIEVERPVKRDNCRSKHDEGRDEPAQEGWQKLIADRGLSCVCGCPTDDTKPGLVLEPFTGRGTTLKAAAELGRDYVGVEISEEYLDIAEGFVPDSKQISITQW